MSATLTIPIQSNLWNLLKSLGEPATIVPAALRQYLDNVTFARHCEERRLRRSNLVLWAGDCFASHHKNHAVLRSQ